MFALVAKALPPKRWGVLSHRSRSRLSRIAHPAPMTPASPTLPMHDPGVYLAKWRRLGVAVSGFRTNRRWSQTAPNSGEHAAQASPYDVFGLRHDSLHQFLHSWYVVDEALDHPGPEDPLVEIARLQHLAADRSRD